MRTKRLSLSAGGRWGLAAGVAFAVVLMAAPAWAVLGQRVQSVAVDHARFGGRLRQIRAQGYTVQVLERGPQQGHAPREIVREYVSPEGMVFGVSWQGPQIPDLPALLGSYFPAFQKEVAAQAARHRRRGPLDIRIGDLVVENAGHMRAFRGRAFVTTLIPRNLSAAVVR